MRPAYLFIALIAIALLVVPSGLAAKAWLEPSTLLTTNGDGAVTWTALSTSGLKYNATVDGSQILLINTTTTAPAWVQNITVYAGEHWRYVLGDKLFQLATNHTYVLGPFESSWFKQYNETILLGTNATRGKIALVLLPR